MDHHRLLGHAPDPRQLSAELRTGTSPHLKRRRWIVGLSLVGVAVGQIVGLYQMGMVRRLPDPPIGPFDSTRVDAAPYGYSRMRTPDALLMIVSYGVTASLAGAGGIRRSRNSPAIPLALAAKTAYDLGLALKLGQEEWRDEHALCFYCQTATVASALSFALAIPEAIDAVRSLTHKGTPDPADAVRRVPRHA